MKLNLNYKFKQQTDSQGKVINEITSQQLTYNYISYAVNVMHKDGLTRSISRIWGRIQDKFEDAMENKADEVELDIAEKEFIVKSFKDAEDKFPAQDSRYINVLEDEIDKLKEEMKEPKEKKKDESK